MKARCGQCEERREVVKVLRKVGGAYNRAARSRMCNICLPCVDALLIRSGHSLVDRWDTGSLRYAAQQARKRQQLLLFIDFEPKPTKGRPLCLSLPIKAPVPVEEIKRVWTLYHYTDAAKPPVLPFLPVHHHNAFLEDYVHDWNIRNGMFRYGSRVTTKPVWVLLELVNPALDVPRKRGV